MLVIPDGVDPVEFVESWGNIQLQSFVTQAEWMFYWIIYPELTMALSEHDMWIQGAPAAPGQTGHKLRLYRVNRDHDMPYPLFTDNKEFLVEQWPSEIAKIVNTKIMGIIDAYMFIGVVYPPNDVSMKTYPSAMAVAQEDPDLVRVRVIMEHLGSNVSADDFELDF